MLPLLDALETLVNGATTIIDPSTVAEGDRFAHPGTAPLSTSAASIEPWIVGSAADPGFLKEWAQWIERDAPAQIHLHPALALSDMQTLGQRAVVYVRRDESRRVRSLAVLANRPYGLELIPGLRWKPRFTGYKLLQSQMLGESTENAAEHFCGQLPELLRTTSKQCLFIEDLDIASPLWRALIDTSRHGLHASQLRSPQPHWSIHFPEIPERYWNQFSSRTRSKFRQKSRKLGELRCFQAEKDVELFAMQARAISQRSWQGKKLGLRIDWGPTEIDHWRTVARLGAMRSYALEHQGQPIAFALAMHWQDTFFYEEIAYDPAYSSLSPGTVLLFRILEDLIEQASVRVLDFGIGDADYKNLFGNHQVSCAPLLVSRQSIRVRCLVEFHLCGKRAGRVLRAGLRKAGAFRIAKRLWKSSG